MRARTMIVLWGFEAMTLVACGGVRGSDGLHGSGGGPASGGGSVDAGAGSSGGSGGGHGGGSGSGSGAGASSGGAGSSGAASSSGSSGGTSSGGSSSGSGGGSSGSGGGDAGAPPPCYSEPYDPHASVADLASAYTGAAWLSSSIEAMHRRYGTGNFVLTAEQADPQLPGFADASAWSALMESLMTMVHEESHGWDFDHAQGTTHPYVITDATQITVPQVTTWPRSDILPYITDASTQSYDQTYLTGEQGTYDAVFLFEELNAYCNGLGAITAVADQVTQPISARDGVAAHLYYLELYLRAGRTAHAADYAALQADASWMHLLRIEWARGHFWDAQAKGNPTLDIASTPIWAHVNDPANLKEILLFTGEDPAAVACYP